MPLALPGASTVLPVTPADGQIYVDHAGVKWRYDAETDLWYRAGVIQDLPLADDRTTGMLSARDKSLLDQIPAVPGGFGIITDRPIITPGNPDGAITGDIELTSESLDIVCIGSDDQPLSDNCGIIHVTDCEGATGPSPGVGFRLSENFLKTLLINLPGPAGPPGDPGETGLQGEPGFSQGPKGDPGPKGDSATARCELVGYRYEDLPGLTDEAVVDLRVTAGCKLSYTKAKLDLPTGPADKVRALPLSRSVIYDTAAQQAQQTCVDCLGTRAKVIDKFGEVTLDDSYGGGPGFLGGCHVVTVRGQPDCETGLRQVQVPLKYTLRCHGTEQAPTLMLGVQYTSCPAVIDNPDAAAPAAGLPPSFPRASDCDNVSGTNTGDWYELPYEGCDREYEFVVPMPDIYGTENVVRVSLVRESQVQCDEPPGLTDWALAQPPGDTTPLDLQLVRLAKNKANSSGDPVAFNTYPLSGFVGDVASRYQGLLEELDERWRKQVREQVLAVDDKARTILSELAGRLADCEFGMPAQVCAITEACAIPPQVINGSPGYPPDDGDPSNPTVVCCFLTGTPVRTARGGTAAIESIAPGQRVLGTTGTNLVLQVKRTRLGDRPLCGVNDGPAFFSADHPLLSTEGWVCADPELFGRLYPGWSEGPVGKLRPGSLLVTEAGIRLVEAVTWLEADPGTVLWDLTLDGDHTYWARGYAVHNCSPVRAAAIRAGYGPVGVGTGETREITIGQRIWKVRL